MLSSLFCSKISNAGRLSTGVLRTYARYPVNSNTSLFRGYATRRLPPTSKVSPSRIQPPVTRRPPSAGAGSRWNKIETMERLYKAGDKVLYQSTKRLTRFRLNSWFILFLAGAGTASLYFQGFLRVSTFRQMGLDNPALIAIAYSISCVFLGGVLAWAFIRSLDHVHSVNLIQQAGKVRLQVTIRRAVPFMKKSFTVEPHDFVVNSRFAAVSVLPQSLIPSAPSESSPSAFTAGVIRESLKSFSRLFYYFFDGARTYLTRQGLYEVDITREEEKGRKTKPYTMDAGADYLQKNEKPALWDLVEIKDPWEYRSA